MKGPIVAAAAVLLSLVLAAEGSPQGGVRWRGGGGWGSGGPYGRAFDPATVETIRGEVESLDLIMPRKGMTTGVHLMVGTAEGPVSVHLGPEWYISRQETEIHPHDAVEVSGSRVVFKGEPAIIASEIRKGDQILRLRDARGIPVWSGWRRR